MPTDIALGRSSLCRQRDSDRGYPFLYRRHKNGKADSRAGTLRRIVAAFEAEGIEFVPKGVLYRSND